MTNQKSLSKVLILMLAPVLAWSCATTAPPKSEPEDQTVEKSEPSIDTWAIRRALKLDREPTELGYKEASFNTCEMGYGYSSSSMCQRHTMAVVHFRIQCRDSEGTVSQAVGAANLRPISAPVKWTIGSWNGVVTTDGEGYGQIVSIFPKSPSSLRLKLAAGTQFLYLMHASEAGRVVVPKQWCE